MEDAMVLNKAALDRGFAHGQIYKTEVIDLKKHLKGSKSNEVTYAFGKPSWKISKLTKRTRII